MPRARWCEVCAIGEGKDDPHVRVTYEKADGQLPMIVMDYAFSKTSGPDCETIDDYGTALVVVDVDAMFPKSVPCESKAVADYSVASIVKLINGFFHGRVRLRTDGEVAIVALADKVVA